MKLPAFVRNPIRAALLNAGYSIQKLKREPYRELLDLPRFTERTVELLGRPFRIADGMSFFYSYREIFVEGIYKFATSSTAPRIIDCGSNYGTSILHFKSVYPAAQITGIEADPYIFPLLRENCSHLDVQLLQRAVSHNHEPVEFSSLGADVGRAGHPLPEHTTTTKVPSIMLDDLIDGHVDYLKIDIEGVEGPSIMACTKLSQVDQMFVEYHSFGDSDQVLGPLLNHLTVHGFRYYIHEQFCSPRPLIEQQERLGMDLQLNIFAKRKP